jgi:hypothetical protein
MFQCSRDDKRYTEKKNKADRARRKKEDTARLRNIVDVSLSADPRIKRIKQEEKEAREAKRKNKPGGAPSKAQAEEEKRRAEEEAKAKEEAEKVCLFRRSQCPRLLMSLCRLRKQRQRRRRLLLPTLRRKHAALREPILLDLRLRNNAPCQGSCCFIWLSLSLCRPHSLVVTAIDSPVTFVLIVPCVHDITHDYVCDV